MFTTAVCHATRVRSAIFPAAATQKKGDYPILCPGLPRGSWGQPWNNLGTFRGVIQPASDRAKFSPLTYPSRP